MIAVFLPWPAFVFCIFTFFRRSNKMAADMGSLAAGLDGMLLD
jgi:hypothetical protein